MNRLSRIHRQEIFDYFSSNQIQWSGALTDDSFLSRIFDLKNLPSNDPRHLDAAGDIWRHRVINDDWPDDWIIKDGRFNLLECDDTIFLSFLCMSLHSSVRPEHEANEIAETLNKLLVKCGFILKIESSTLGVNKYVSVNFRRTETHSFIASEEVIRAIDSAYIDTQTARMIKAIDEDTELAIGTAKEFVETICKSILSKLEITLGKDASLIDYVKETRKNLNLLPEDVPDHAKGKDIIKKLLSNLGTIAQDMAELRSLYGTGHGKDAYTVSLWKRHARLAVNSAIALGVFLWETHEERK